MNTEDLIRALAKDGRTAAGRSTVGRRVAIAAATSLAAVVVVTILTLGVRPGLADSTATPGGIAKFVLALLIAAAACVSLARGAEPGRRAHLDAICIAVGFMLAAGAFAAIGSPHAALAGSPMECLVSILGLAILPFVALLATLREGASTRPEATGAVAGIAAGGFAAFAFGLSCPMDLGPYVALWYSLAIAMTGALGFVVGRRALNW